MCRSGQRISGNTINRQSGDVALIIIAISTILLTALTLAQTSFADEVNGLPSEADKAALSAPDPHVVGLAKDLMKQLEKTHFKDLESARLVSAILKKSRLQSWKAGPIVPKDLDSEAAKRLASHSIFVEQLGDAYGLLTFNDDRHHEAVEALLAATDQKQREARLRDVLKLSGVDNPSSDERQEALAKFTNFMAQTYFGQQTRAGLETIDDGDRVLFEWDPDRGDFVARIQPADGSDEIVLHGGVSVEFDGGAPKLVFKLDNDPVTIMDKERREAVNRALFGEWINPKDGSRWQIEAADGTQTPEVEVDIVATEIKRMKSELQKLKGETIHIWINEETGKNTIQYKYKRLKSPFVYMKDLSRNFYKDKIELLEREIQDREASSEALPVDRFDPLKADGKGIQVRAASLQISRLDGYQYAYETVSYDGKRLTGKRTLRDMRDVDVDAHPSGVAQQLIAQWSPPEWVELKPYFRPRTRDVVLAGKVWRLHYSADSGLFGGGNYTVSSIQDPYIDEVLSLTKAASAVRLQFVNEDNQPFSGELPFGKPIRIEAEFDDVPEQAKRSVQLSWKAARPSNALLDVFRSADRPKIYLSEPFILDASKEKAAVPANEADK